ncbi:RagB/SusD family nutrient uptake outer membrane protein [Prevotella cerevisiae]|uniref:RagB/SusD family nutrient uptake outer membrane protein n=1 Tax=Segatella cerevisiae TaxID=2053716 RepID=A0ABT1BYF5_9BACT|nr:RagB/SusD family nutrient uptake outer membrane protein [Segatella cerevisiae]MCO6025408.1 RagB/SusD family nutrient uptake outer membrane protein [Segatella cerevisiae]
MKINKNILGITCILLGLASCSDQLNYHEYDNVNKDYISRIYDRVDGLVSNIYSQLDYDYGDSYGGGMLSSASDESVYCNTSATVNTFFNGSWSASNPLSSQWSASYYAIADCNDFLYNFKDLDFEDQLNTDNYYRNLAQYERFPYEVKLLRAYFYFLLVRQYGDIPYYTANLTPEERNTLKRMPAEDVLDSVIATCNAVQDHLPIDYTNLGSNTMSPAETGRFNKLVAMSLKARAALYAASPLFNADGSHNDKYLLAAQTCQAVLDSAALQNIHLGNYTSNWGPSNFMPGNSNNPEMIYARRVDDYNKPESRNFPVGIGSAGAGGNCPSETLAEAFQTKNGYDVILTDNGFESQDPTFNPEKPFDNRDPRFGMVFAVNGEKKWPTVNGNALETFYGGVSGEPKVGGTPTGYYLKKLLDGSLDLSSTGTKKTSRHSWMTFRLGEIYLDYAEAAFRATGSYTTVPQGCKLTALQAVNMIRERTGVNMPALPSNMTNDEFWEKYKNERFVEMCFEDQRFFDVRRWKEADQYFKKIKELKITKNADGSLSYRPDYQVREWDDKMYFFPIPQVDILKSNGNLTQNPGWK